MPKTTKINDQNYIPVDILVEVLKCCQTLGGNSTLLILKAAQSKSKNFSEISDIIIDTVCKELKVSRFRLFERNSYGNKTTAIMFVFVLHRSLLNLDINQMQEFFNEKYKTIWSHLKRFEELQETHITDFATLKKFNSIVEIIKTKIDGNE
jgi:hypothetical protein